VSAAVGLRLTSFHRFLREVVPTPSRLLEVGCGKGELAVLLAADRHEVVAIDPEAPDGPLFRRIRLEELDESEPYDVAVASVALHHVDDLGAAAERLAALVRPGGLLVLEEFAKERLEGPTAWWYYHQRRALAAVRRDDHEIPDEFERWQEEIRERLADVHPVADLFAAVGRRFTERRLEWTPYLYDYRLDDSLEPAERALIDSGEIAATGCRYVGERVGPGS
jgi:SAM-dependent methyltransferase